MDRKTPLTEFDINTTSWLLQMAKAALPFFDMGFQRNAAMLIRFMELQYTLKFFCNGDFFQQSSLTGHRGISLEYIKELAGNEQFLEAISPYCPSVLFGIIKNYKLFAGMSDLFKNSGMQNDIFKNVESFSGMSDLFKNGNMQNDILKNAESFSGMSDLFKNGNSMFMSQMSGEQKNLYDEYLKHLDNIL